jgi:hypothetical protein
MPPLRSAGFYAAQAFVGNDRAMIGLFDASIDLSFPRTFGEIIPCG